MDRLSTKYIKETEHKPNPGREIDIQYRVSTVRLVYGIHLKFFWSNLVFWCGPLVTLCIGKLSMCLKFLRDIWETDTYGMKFEISQNINTKYYTPHSL